MIIFLYGKDAYRSKQRLNVLREEFMRKKDKKGLNVCIFEAHELSLDELRKSFLSAGLFSEKRLMIIKNILLAKTAKKDGESRPVPSPLQTGGNPPERQKILFEEIIKILKKNKKDEDFPAQTKNVIIFWDEEVNEKKLNSFQKKIFILLKKERFCEEFKLLNAVELKKWIKKRVNNQGFKIDEQSLTLLINAFGNNLWLLNNELEKLMAWKITKKEIVFSDLQKFVFPGLEQNIWKLVDSLGQKNKALALKILSDQFKQNVDVAQVITLLAHQYRTIIRIKSYLEKNPINNPYQLAKILSLHPFVCQKAVAQEKNYNLNQLKKTYQQLLKIDLWRKTKNIDSETLLDLLIAKS
ncbi:MAG: DNA polymerase III subunit delta [Patescibacteria group bacterium]|nr:DNA polymerase III subunit delta [Patescibacteria group bacterium]